MRTAVDETRSSPPASVTALFDGDHLAKVAAVDVPGGGTLAGYAGLSEIIVTKGAVALAISVQPGMEAAFNEVLQRHGMKVGQVMPLYRLFVAGRMQGPGMFDVSALLGKEEVVARLRAGLEHCRAWA